MKQTTSRRLTFQNRFLRVDLDAAEVTWSVTEKATGVVWRMAPSAAQDVTVADTAGNRRAHAFASSADRAVQASRNGLPGACIGLRDLGLGIHAFLDGRALVVEIERCAGASTTRRATASRRWPFTARRSATAAWSRSPRRPSTSTWP